LYEAGFYFVPLFYNKKQIGDGQVKTLEGTLKAAAAKGKKLAMDWSQGQSVYSFFGKTGLNLSLNDDGTTNACNWNSTDHEIKGVTVAGAMGSIAGNKGFECAQGAIEMVNLIREIG